VILRGLLCAFVLFASCALAQPEPRQADSTPRPDAGEALLPQLRVECTPAWRAEELIGKHGCVAGRVYHIQTTKHGSVSLSLCAPHSKCSFHAMAHARDTGSVGDLYPLRGEIVAVIGDVVKYRGHPEIFLRDRSQIRVAAGDPPPEFDASQKWPTHRRYPGSNLPIPGLKRGRAW
jgi:hypothetical protein